MSISSGTSSGSPWSFAILKLSHITPFFLPAGHEVSVTVHNAGPCDRAENIKHGGKQGYVFGSKAPSPIPSCYLRGSGNNIWCVFRSLMQWDYHWFKLRTAISSFWHLSEKRRQCSPWGVAVLDTGFLTFAGFLPRYSLPWRLPGFWVPGKSLYMTKVVWTNNYVSSSWQTHSTLQIYLPPFERYFAEFEIAGYSVIPNFCSSARRW